MNDPILSQMKNAAEVQIAWDLCFEEWQKHGCVESLENLRTLRKNGYFLNYKSIHTGCWMPTILNQIVNLNGNIFINNPLVRCFSENVSFDLVLAKQVPYYIERIDIDIIDELGAQPRGQRTLNHMVELADHIGCAIRISDHAEIKSTIPNTLISLINDANAATFPQANGFTGEAVERSTRERIAFWRVQHQEQVIHFINARGKVETGKIEELCEFFKNNLPNDLKNCFLKLSLREYIRAPTAVKKTILLDLL